MANSSFDFSADNLLTGAYDRRDLRAFNSALMMGADPNICINSVPLMFLLIESMCFKELKLLLSFGASVSAGVRHHSLTVLHALLLCPATDILPQFYNFMEKGKFTTQQLSVRSRLVQCLATS